MEKTRGVVCNQAAENTPSVMPYAQGDDAVISGESGAVCAGLVFELMTSRELAELRARLSLNDASRVLCISTEGATDKAVFEEITGISPV